MLKKTLLIMVAVAFMCVPALAGDRPEFDGVGDDSTQYFNDLVKGIVVAANPWNTNSDWIPAGPEEFDPPTTLLTDGVCFPNYEQSLTRRQSGRTYRWVIVLQMDPQTDLDINIRDCVVKYNSFTAFGDSEGEGAAQTGRTEDFWGFPLWDAARNPRVTAVAYPGPFAVNGFDLPFFLTSRTQGGLRLLDLVDLLYSSKGVWEEGLLVRMPMDGIAAPPAQAPWCPTCVPVESTLSAGDYIEVFIDVPNTNPTDIRYGKDNVVIKYVGITGTVATP